jgi:hypothetical protein
MKRWDGHWGIVSPFKKRLGPDGAVHQGWCPIFEHECCCCGPGDDDGDGGAKPKPLTPNNLESVE